MELKLVGFLSSSWHAQKVDIFVRIPHRYLFQPKIWAVCVLKAFQESRSGEYIVGEEGSIE